MVERFKVEKISLSSINDWFKRPCGGIEVFRVGFPIVVSSTTFALMHFADRLFLTWYDQRAMSAAFQAGMLM